MATMRRPLRLRRVALPLRSALLLLLELAAFAALVYGAWLVYRPLGWLVAGGLVLFVLQGFDR